MHSGWINSPRRLAALGSALLLGAACGKDGTGVAQASTANCMDTGELRGRIYGEIEGQLDWRGEALSCDGMPRPGDAGARLRFAGTLDDNGLERDLALIIALPQLERGRTAAEIPAKVTMIEEDTGRFFSTGDVDVCWSDVTFHEKVDEDSYEIRGIVYCMSPLAELNSSGGVSFTELSFAGQVDWSGSR